MTKIETKTEEEMIIPHKRFKTVMSSNYKQRLVEIIKIEDNFVNTYYDCGKGKPTCLGEEINIYEFVHICKEWALSEGITFNIQMSKDITLLYIPTHNMDIEAKTEFKAVIKACSWLLNNKRRHNYVSNE